MNDIDTQGNLYPGRYEVLQTAPGKVNAKQKIAPRIMPYPPGSRTEIRDTSLLPKSMF
jgi:hypothetical protein